MMRGPVAMFAAWALHDAEEALTFPATADHLAEVSGIEALRMSTRQSVAAIGLVGAVVAAAGVRGMQTRGRSALYRSTVAGLEAHVFTHLLATAVLRRYTAGVITTVPIMWPGAALARRELAELGHPLTGTDWKRGIALMGAVAAAAQLTVRIDWTAGLSSHRSRRRRLRGCAAAAGAGA